MIRRPLVRGLGTRPASERSRAGVAPRLRRYALDHPMRVVTDEQQLEREDQATVVVHKQSTVHEIGTGLYPWNLRSLAGPTRTSCRRRSVRCRHRPSGSPVPAYSGGLPLATTATRTWSRAGQWPAQAAAGSVLLSTGRRSVELALLDPFRRRDLRAVNTVDPEALGFSCRPVLAEAELAV